MTVPKVADMAHFNPVNFTQIKAAGIVGVIHKASQGVGMTDNQYARRRSGAAAVGLKWGAYSFATGDDARAHARHFLAVAAPDAETLCCLDYEDNAKSPMSATQAWDRRSPRWGSSRPRSQLRRRRGNHWTGTPR